MKIRKLYSIGLMLVLCGAAVIIGAKSKQMITVKGSDTMVILAQRWAELYMNSHPDVTIQVNGGGSGVGISALINGTTEICNASRPMKGSERDKLKQRHNSLGYEIPAAKDGITIYVHESNLVSQLSLQQLQAIFTGEMTNWRDVGGVDSKIILYGRENSSGTYVYFRDNVLKGKDYAASTQTLPGTAAVVNAVSKDKNGIGYGGAAYSKGVRIIAVKAQPSSEAVIPNAETIKNGTYPIARDLYMYLRSKPTGTTKEYIDWILSSEGQSIVTQVGYFPIN